MHQSRTSASNDSSACDSSAKVPIMNAQERKQVTLSNYEPKLPEPADDLTLWRYLDFPKLIDLLSTSTLKLPRASLMEDGYEGILGAASIDAGLTAMKSNGEPSYLRNASIGMELKRSHFLQQSTYISCWNAFPKENAGLWRVYGDDKGVVVKTTWKRLKDSLSTADCVSTIFYGEVVYRDYDTDASYTSTYTDQFFSKRVEFVHENEFRLVAHYDSNDLNYNTTDTSLLPHFATVKCDLSLLIEELMISPRLGAWVKSGITDLCSKFGGTWAVSHSKLYDPPELTTSKF